MCDYSLHSIRNRLAEEGEELVVYRFPTNSLGLAAAKDVEPDLTASAIRFWPTAKRWFRSALKEPACAVCIPPGARLMLRDIPERLQRQLGVSAEEDVTFTQLTASANCYRDAVRFRTGAEVLLQRLEPGQRVDVLSLSLTEAEARPRVAATVSR